MATKVYVDDKYEVTIICEECGKWKRKEVSSFIKAHKSLKVKCNCGHIFDIILEIRNCYRKTALLKGLYTKTEREEGTFMTIENISQGGVGFRANYKHKITINEILQIKFTLDDAKQSEIYRAVWVKHINDRAVGTQFCASDTYKYRKELGFYLMSN